MHLCCLPVSETRRNKNSTLHWCQLPNLSLTIALAGVGVAT